MPQPTVVKDPDDVAGPKQTEDMPALCAKEMCPTAFHLFPNLAPELRLKIWKAACFPYAANHRGLHYIDLKNVDEISGDAVIGMNSMEMKALHPDFQTSANEQQVVGCANRSAYMWDGGLWKACRESREVISTHFRLKVWRRTQENEIDPLELDEGLIQACQPYLYGRYSEESTSEDDEELYEKRPDHEGSVHDCEPFLPTCLLFRNQGHAERFMVMPTRDLFCIKDPKRSLLPLTLEASRLHVPCPNGKKIVLRHSFNLVLEFDTSWNDEFLLTWKELREEDSPRGLFASWAETCMWGDGNATWIYLLNKAARWGPYWRVKDDVIFYDCDDAYVEVTNDWFGFYPAKPAEASAMLTFLFCVWRLQTLSYCRNCTDDEICSLCRYVPGFDLSEYVKVLVRHEEEPAADQIEERVDELDELDDCNDREIEREGEDGEEGKEASELQD
ncbi:hypothetical protein FBULB1_611 [Fusarium bulbicola]|nr:hypothetical protein FBULB1_611 [Fusarium bulbicola]